MSAINDPTKPPDVLPVLVAAIGDAHVTFFAEPTLRVGDPWIDCERLCDATEACQVDRERMLGIREWETRRTVPADALRRAVTPNGVRTLISIVGATMIFQRQVALGNTSPDTQYEFTLAVGEARAAMQRSRSK